MDGPRIFLPRNASDYCTQEEGARGSREDCGNFENSGVCPAGRCQAVAPPAAPSAVSSTAPPSARLLLAAHSFLQRLTNWEQRSHASSSPVTVPPPAPSLLSRQRQRWLDGR